MRCERRRTVKMQDGRLASIACRSRRCPACGPVWARDRRRVLRTNLEHYGGDVAMATVTAPGRAGGLVDDVTIRRWNRTAPARWRRLHRAASQAAMRETGRRPFLLGKTWEYQRRGALHAHLVLGMATKGERAAARAYMRALEALGGSYAYGFVSDTRRGEMARAWRWLGPEVIPAQRAANYVCKYVCPLDGDGKATVSDTARRDDSPGHIVHVSRVLTGGTGCTMKSVRYRRQAFRRGFHPTTGETHVSMIRRHCAGQADATRELIQLGILKT